MSASMDTCWGACCEAAGGDHEERDAFVERYRGPVRAYLAGRWPAGPLSEEVDDVVREVFEVCFEAATAGGEESAEPSFRSHLLRLANDAARRIEEFHEREYGEPAARVPDEAVLELAFDLDWARLVMREAAARQKARAMLAGQDAMRRAELLRLRVRHGLAIEAVARRWKSDTAVLVREERVARGEFDAALRGVLAFHCGDDEEVATAEREHLLDVLATA